MKKISISLIIIMFMIYFAGCSAYVRYPSIGVRIGPKWVTKYECHWVLYNHHHRVKRCHKVRVRVY